MRGEGGNAPTRPARLQGCCCSYSPCRAKVYTMCMSTAPGHPWLESPARHPQRGMPALVHGMVTAGQGMQPHAVHASLLWDASSAYKLFPWFSSSSRKRLPNASPSGLLGHRSHSHALVSHKCKAQATTAVAVQQGFTGNPLQDPPQGTRGRQAPRRPPSIRGFQTLVKVQAILYYQGA